MRYFMQVDPPAFDTETNSSIPRIIARGETGEEIQTRKTVGSWVPVKTRRPSSSGHFLVLLRGRRHRLMEFSVADQTFIPKGLGGAVTHWMPLPPAPSQRPG